MQWPPSAHTLQLVFESEKVEPPPPVPKQGKSKVIRKIRPWVVKYPQSCFSVYAAAEENLYVSAEEISLALP